VDFANITIEPQFSDYASSAFVQQMGRRCVGEKVIRVESGCCGAPCSFRNGNSDTFYGLVIDNYRGRGSLEICSPFTVLEYVPESIRSELMRGWSTAAPECHTVSVSDITSVARSLFDVEDTDGDSDDDDADAADADADTQQLSQHSKISYVDYNQDSRGIRKETTVVSCCNGDIQRGINITELPMELNGITMIRVIAEWSDAKKCFESVQREQLCVRQFVWNSNKKLKHTSLASKTSAVMKQANNELKHVIDNYESSTDSESDSESDLEPAPSPAPSPAPRRTTRKPCKRDFLKACSSHEYNRSKKLKK
jgi:hypothetical protein